MRTPRLVSKVRGHIVVKLQGPQGRRGGAPCSAWIYTASVCVTTDGSASLDASTSTFAIASYVCPCIQPHLYNRPGVRMRPPMKRPGFTREGLSGIYVVFYGRRVAEKGGYPRSPAAGLAYVTDTPERMSTEWAPICTASARHGDHTCLNYARTYHPRSAFATINDAPLCTPACPVVRENGRRSTQQACVTAATPASCVLPPLYAPSRPGPR